MSQDINLPSHPILQNQLIKSRQGGLADSLRFSYDFDTHSSLAYSQDGRQIDFDFQQFPQFEFKNDNQKSVSMDSSTINRRLQIFSKYRQINQTVEFDKKNDIIDSFDQIFSKQNSSKFGFKRKQNNQQPIIQTTNLNKETVKVIEKQENSKIKQNNSLFLLQNQSYNKQQDSSEQKKQLQGREKIKTQNSTNLDDQNPTDTFNASFQSISSINTVTTNSINIGQGNNFIETIINGFTNIDDKNKISQQNQKQKPNVNPSNQKIQTPLQKQQNEKGAIQILYQKIYDFLSGSKSVSVTNYVSDKAEQQNIKQKLEQQQNNQSVSNFLNQNPKILKQTSSAPNKVPSSIMINNKSITKPLSMRQIIIPAFTLENTNITTFIPTNLTHKVSINQMTQRSNKLGNPIFEEQNRIAPFLRKIRKMNSIYPNFNHPNVNIAYQTKFCNILAVAFQQALIFLEKMTNRAFERIKQPRYFPAQLASLSHFINSKWQQQRQGQWDLINSTMRPRTNFAQNQIDQGKIRGALINYKEVIFYYKQRKIDLSNQQGIKSYFRIRQKFWSLERNMKSISQDVYRLLQKTQYPHFYYDYLKVLRSPLPSKNDQLTIQHHQHILNILILNRQIMEPLSCSQVGLAVKIKLERQLKFLCPF